jgi:hypothetical protein
MLNLWSFISFCKREVIVGSGHMSDESATIFIVSNNMYELAETLLGRGVDVDVAMN